MEFAEVVVYWRTTQGFVREVHAGMEAELLLGEVGNALRLAEIYEGVRFSPEPEEEE